MLAALDGVAAFGYEEKPVEPAAPLRFDGIEPGVEGLVVEVQIVAEGYAFLYIVPGFAVALVIGEVSEQENASPRPDCKQEGVM